MRGGILLTILLAFNFTHARQHKRVLKLMGSRFEITAHIDDNQILAEKAVEAAILEISRIEQLISSWDAGSQTSQINRSAGIEPVVVDQELIQLIYRAKKISNLTSGAFDISYASMDEVWKFDGTMTKVPSAKEISASVSKINYQDIEVDKEKSTVFLRKKGMKIGFGAIGKGYAANRGKQIMQEMGIESGVVNAGGDLISWGFDQQHEPWRITIADPTNRGKAIGWLNTNDLAIVTSGNYEKFVMIDGQKFSHIIDPRTGYPVRGLKSVTIVCADAELADALATSVFVMGKDGGLELINSIKGVECLLVDDNNKLLTSSNLNLNYYE